MNDIYGGLSTQQVLDKMGASKTLDEKAFIKGKVINGSTVVSYKPEIKSGHPFPFSKGPLQFVCIYGEKDIRNIPTLRGHDIDVVYLSQFVEHFSVEEKGDIFIGNIVVPKTSNLKTLRIKNNYLHIRSTKSKWKGKPHLNISHAKNLEELIVNHSFIKSIFLPRGHKLKKLKCRNNLIEEINLPESLEDIDIRNNKMEDVYIPPYAKRFKCDNINILGEIPEDCKVIIKTEEE